MWKRWQEIEDKIAWKFFVFCRWYMFGIIVYVLIKSLFF